MIENLPSKSLSEIAEIVIEDWKSVYFAAVPYLQAMFSLNTIQDNYGFDSAKDIVARFLGNAASWRGEVAKQVKTELKKRIK